MKRPALSDLNRAAWAALCLPALGAFSLLGTACSSGQTGDAGLGVSAAETTPESTSSVPRPPASVTAPDAGAGEDDTATAADDSAAPANASSSSGANPNITNPSVTNPSGDCAAADNGGRPFDHSPDPTDVYLPDCTLELNREYYRVFQQTSGTAYMMPRPDGHPALIPLCENEDDPLHALVNEYQLCASATTTEAVDLTNNMLPADALELAHYLHSQLVFYETAEGVSPDVYISDLLDACKSDATFREGALAPRCDRELQAEQDSYRTGESLLYTPEQALALADKMNELYGITGEALCDRLQASARETFSAALDSSKACTSDEQCVEVAHASACHDSCGAIASELHTAALEQSRDALAGAQCTAFERAACTLIHPPCEAPSGQLRCAGGQCASLETATLPTPP